MLVTMRSMFSGKVHTKEIPITEAQWIEWNAPQPRRLVQDIFPNLEPWQREYLMTGVTKEEWEQEFRPKTWFDMAERLRVGDKVRMTRSVVCGYNFAEGKTYTVSENHLNELQTCVFLMDEHEEQWLLPGPKRSDSQEWDDLAPFEVLINAS